MKYIDINKRFTEIVNEYLGNGYTINTSTMSGSQGETARVDVTDGAEVIRIVLDSFYTGGAGLDGMKILVGRAEASVKPHIGSDRYVVWNNRLEVLRSEPFYKIGSSRNGGGFYGTKAEAEDAHSKRVKRYENRPNRQQEVDFTENTTAMEIAKRIIRKRLDVRRIIEADVRVYKRDGKYMVSYRRRLYRLR